VKPEAKLAFFRTFDIQFGSNLIFGIAIIQDISNVFSNQHNGWPIFELQAPSCAEMIIALL
jgi:hypothetical protein